MSHKPLVISSGQIQQLPSGEALNVGWDLPVTGPAANSVLICTSGGVITWPSIGASKYFSTDSSGNVVFADKPWGLTTAAPTADNQILQATGAGTAAWTTDVQTLTSLVVDNLTLNGATVVSSSGEISFEATNLRTNGNVAIGTLPNSSFGLLAQIIYTSTSGTFYGTSNRALANPAANSSASYIGMQCFARALSTNNFTGYFYGGMFSTEHAGTGVIDDAHGVRAYVQNSSSGTITNAYGCWISTFSNPGGGSFGTAVGVYLSAITPGATNWQVYSEAGNWRVGNDNSKMFFGSGNDASFYYDGTNFYCNPKEVGSGEFIVLGNIRLNDSFKLKLGTSGDAEVYYDGTDLVVDPDAVGSGHLKINGATDIVGGLTVDGVSVSGEIQIGDSEVCRILAENRTYYVRTTGNDTTGDGSAGTPFATVGRALDEIYKWVADENIITIDVGEGTFNETTLSPTYAYGSNLYVTGVAETHTSGCAVSSIGSVTALEAGLEYIDFIITLPVGYTTSTGQYIACKAASGGTNNHLVLGVHEVIGWNSGTRAATVRCVRRAGVTAVPSGAISLTDIRVIKTVLAFASGHGISMTGTYHGGNWDRIVLAGNSSGYALNLLSGASFSAGESFGTSNWNHSIYCAGNGNFFGDSTCHSFCRGSLLRVQNGGVAQIRYGAVLTGAKTNGMFCFVGGTIAAYQVQMATCGNADGVMCYQGGFVDVSSGYVRDGNPTGNGCNANRGGGIDASSATISGYANSTATATEGFVIGP